jgi:hypothetical protein
MVQQKLKVEMRLRRYKGVRKRFLIQELSKHSIFNASTKKHIFSEGKMVKDKENKTF